MRDGNVIVSGRDGGFTQAHRLLGEFGPVSPSEVRDVLVMWVENPRLLLEALTARAAGGTVVTNNTREFSRVPDLAVEDWTIP